MTTSVVQFLDLGSAYREAKPEIDAAMARVATSGWFLMGQELAAFEEQYARFCGSQYCAGVANGLDALHLSLLALGVTEGDEVIVPSNTYIATWLAVSMCRARVVPVEPIEATYNMDPERVAASITTRTKVILPVHLYGQPADMDPINALAKDHGLKVLDDCAQAHGATYKGRPVGSLADLSAWSFYPGKNLGAFGDAGAITGSDSSIVGAVRVLGNYGSKIKYHNEVKGFNSRLDEVQAAVLAAKLTGLNNAIQRRRSIASRYIDGMQGLPIVLPQVPKFADPAWHLFVIRHAKRDLLQSKLAAMGIGTLIHYPIAPHLQPAYREMNWRKGEFPVAERIHEEVLSLPIWPAMDDASVDRVIEAVRRCA